MKYDDLKFTIINNNGEKVQCDILSLFPKNDFESYVVFIDDERDENNNIVLKYGRLIKEDNEYELKSGIDDDELNYIKDKFHDDLVDLANSIIKDER